MHVECHKCQYTGCISSNLWSGPKPACLEALLGFPRVATKGFQSASFVLVTLVPQFNINFWWNHVDEANCAVLLLFKHMEKPLCLSDLGGCDVSELGKVQFHQNHFHQKKNFIKNHFHQKPLSSKNHFHQEPFSSETIFVRTNETKGDSQYSPCLCESVAGRRPATPSHKHGSGPPFGFRV